MARFAIKTISTKEKIKTRVMELFETADDLKKLFNSFLPRNSLLKSILKIDDYADKDKICDIVLSYLGNNFFVYVGEVRPDSDDDDDVTQFDRKIDPVYIVREKFLDQICIYNKDNSDKKRQEIIDSFNENQINKVTTLKELSQHKYFLSKTWAKNLCNKVLLLPDTIVEKPQTEPQSPETIALRKKDHLPRLYDFQTEGLIKIHNMLNNAEDIVGRQKRLLVNVPTGAGKTRLTVQAIIEWLNLREQGKSENAHEQQKNPNGLIFWLASTNELCNQASDTFQQIFNDLGTAGLINLTNWYGSKRRDLKNIRDDKPGTHIVITNTHHTNKKFRHFRNKEAGKFRFDQFKDSPELAEIRENTIAIVIDEAHEVTGERYQDFLAAMGFDFSGRTESLKNINTNNIVLIGLTATAYKGSGFKNNWRCVSCDKIVNSQEKIHHRNSTGHSNYTVEEEEDDFLKLDEKNDPVYFKTLDTGTKKIHKTFGGVYVPIPHPEQKDSKPSAIIDAPIYAHQNESVKISGLNSFDSNSEISYLWEIRTFETIDFKTEPVFYYKFKTNGKFKINLKVTNENNVSDIKDHEIFIEKSQPDKKDRTGNLQDNKEFYDILEKRKILCKITHGVIDGPQLKFDKTEFRRWKLGKLSGENVEKINNAETYNRNICETANKCIKNHKKERVLIFANSVKHSRELALILGVKYQLKTKSIDGNTNPGLRRKIVKDYREGKINVLCNFGVLTTGFDVPKIDVVVICRDVGSNALYTQMIGRGQRGKVSGGTDELWLITSFFPKPEIEQGKLKLGWEALAESWNKFPPDIREDLRVKDFTVPSNESELKTNVIKLENKNPQILSLDPLKLKCMTCKVEKEGLENVEKWFGEIGNMELIHDKIKKGTFPKSCKACRQINKIGRYTKCDFCELFSQHHNYDPIFIRIVNILKNCQIKKESVNLAILQDKLYNQFKAMVKRSYFGMNNPAIKKMESVGLLKIKDNLEIEFKEILEIETITELIKLSYNAEENKKNIRKIVNENKNVIISGSESDNLQTFYSELKKSHGHIPTKRQFNSAIFEKEELLKEFKQVFDGSYEVLLNLYIEFIKDDEKLKDVLYDEYFEKCISVRGKITREQLDKHGKYRISDYEDIFESFDSFEKKVELNLKRVLDNYDQKKKDTDKEFVEIGKDLKYLKEILHRTPHFEEIRMHSRIGVYRYVIQTKISYLHYLEKYHGKNIGSFFRLVNEFFRLQRILGMTPTQKQFTDLTSASVTAELGAAFNFNFDEFLKIINVEPSSVKLNSEHIEKMRQNTIKKLKEIESKDGKEKVINVIESAQNKSDELSISINAWFKDKDSLKKEF